MFSFLTPHLYEKRPCLYLIQANGILNFLDTIRYTTNIAKAKTKKKY